MLNRIILFSILITYHLFAQGTFYVDRMEIVNNVLIIYSGQNKLTFNNYDDNKLRVNYLESGHEDKNTMILGTFDKMPSPMIIDTSGKSIKIKTSGYSVEIEKRPLIFRILDKAGKSIIETGASALNSNNLELNISGGTFYGVKNSTHTLVDSSGGEIKSGKQGEAGAPFIWTTKGWGLLVDSDGGKFELSSNQLSFSRPGSAGKRDLEIFFFFGKPKELITSLNEITGMPPLFPKSSLGFLNSEWGIDEAELKDNIKTYRSKKIPVDAYILDFDWMDWGNPGGEFKWGPKFPTGPNGRLKAFIDSVHMSLFGIRKPRIHLNTPEGDYCMQNGFFADTSRDYWSKKAVGRLDFNKKEVRNWFWNSFIKTGDIYNKGITGYWNDEADEYGGNLMFMQMQRANYEGQRSYNNKRVWSINRNFFLGAQRYAYGHWSGDINTSFTSMADQRAFMLSSILLGSSWWSMDAGGYGGPNPTPENYFRWVQFAAFVPIFRVHGSFNKEREPWTFGPEAEAIASKYIKLRYELMPYIYSAAWYNHLTGVSIARPLVMEYPDDENAKDNFSEWLFGNDILVSPVVEENSGSVSVYIPEGTWIDYRTHEVHKGPGAIKYKITREDIPLFIRAGAVIPIQPVGLYCDDPKTTDRIILNCYPGGSSASFLYDDDGITYNYEKGEYCTTDLAYSEEGNIPTLIIGERNGSYKTPKRDYIVKFMMLDKMPEMVKINNRNIQKADLNKLPNTSITGWAYDQKEKCCYVRIPDNGHKTVISISYRK